MAIDHRAIDQQHCKDSCEINYPDTMNRSYNNRSQVTNLKPEYALKRVNDLIARGGINNDKEKRLALDQLHAVIGVKRKGAWTKTFEALMKRHVELCVDLKDHHTAKDGLHQYRNLCQSVSQIFFEYRNQELKHQSLFVNQTDRSKLLRKCNCILDGTFRKSSRSC